MGWAVFFALILFFGLSFISLISLLILMWNETEPRKARPRRPTGHLYPTDQTATAVGDAPK